MFRQEIIIPLSSVKLSGELVIPDYAQGIIIFSHGSGSSRYSPRNRYVAGVMQKHFFATLLFDLLTEEEDTLYENRFDIDLLTGRLIQVTQWVSKFDLTHELNIGYFGASTGAASAIKAAAFLGDTIQAVVSRGGRPDLALEALGKLKSPVLLLVGSLDHHVIEFNRSAFDNIGCEKEFKIVTGASHLFEESGKLEEVSIQAATWYERHLRHSSLNPKPKAALA